MRQVKETRKIPYVALNLTDKDAIQDLEPWTQEAQLLFEIGSKLLRSANGKQTPVTFEEVLQAKFKRKLYRVYLLATPEGNKFVVLNLNNCRLLGNA